MLFPSWFVKRKFVITKIRSESIGYPKGINGAFALGIDLPFFEDVDPEYERLVKAGAVPVYAPRNEPWGMRSSMVTDPEGNLLEIGSWNKGPEKY